MLCSMDDDDLPRQRGDAASLLAGEVLDSYSQDELQERIAVQHGFQLSHHKHELYGLCTDREACQARVAGRRR